MNTLKQILRLKKSFYLYIRYPMSVIISRNFNRSYSVIKDEKNMIPKEVCSTKPFNENEDHTWVGPPHPISNLRLKVFPASKNLTKEEVHFYEKSKETQEWNQQYWDSHNRDFEKAKKSYMDKITMEKKLDSKNSLTPEDMAAFYKEFLDKNYKKHISYNWKWYKRNFELLYLSAVAQVSKLRKLVKRDIS